MPIPVDTRARNAVKDLIEAVRTLTDAVNTLASISSGSTVIKEIMEIRRNLDDTREALHRAEESFS